MPLWISPDAFPEPCPCPLCVASNAAIQASKEARAALRDAQAQAERAAAAAQSAGAKVDQAHSLGQRRYPKR